VRSVVETDKLIHLFADKQGMRVRGWQEMLADVIEGDRDREVWRAVALDHVRQNILPVSDAHTRLIGKQMNEFVGLDDR
jgi:hypothetical protein